MLTDGARACRPISLDRRQLGLAREEGYRPVIPLMSRDKTGTSMDNTGTSRDKTGTAGTKQGQYG